MTITTKELPILFSGPEIPALLDGTKTQTRRVIVPQDLVEHEDGKLIYVHRPRCPDYCDYACAGRDGFSPYTPGLKLWVRETWGVSTCNAATGCIVYRADGSSYHALAEDEGEGDLCGVDDACTHGHLSVIRWHPSIHMPRWASRITLEVTEVRVQRAQEISGGDGTAEGYPLGTEVCDVGIQSKSRISWFQNRWDSINAKRGYGWTVNPFCRVLTFRRVRP